MKELTSRFHNWRFRHENESGRLLWSTKSFLSCEELNATIAEHITGRIPFMAGKIGGFEARTVLWATGLALALPWLGRWRTRFWETHGLDLNAGIKPREKSSCRKFSDIMIQALRQLNLVGIYRLQTEYVLCERFSPFARFCDPEQLSPTLADKPWSTSLAGKTVFVVSPFLASFQQQQSKLSQVWKEKLVMPECQVVGYRFPYLIEDESGLTWWQVFEDVKTTMQKTDYDVALLGCGGLGLPLAAFAKEQGRIGIHLGGALQLLFGVYGNRHLEQSWHRRWINEAWIRPAPDEVPKCAGRVENACYW